MPARPIHIIGYLDYRHRAYCFNLANFLIISQFRGEPVLLLIRLDNNVIFLKACALAYRLLCQIYSHLFIVGLLLSNYP